MQGKQWVPGTGAGELRGFRRCGEKKNIESCRIPRSTGLDGWQWHLPGAAESQGRGREKLASSFGRISLSHGACVLHWVSSTMHPLQPISVLAYLSGPVRSTSAFGCSSHQYPRFFAHSSHFSLLKLRVVPVTSLWQGFFLLSEPAGSLLVLNTLFLHICLHGCYKDRRQKWHKFPCIDFLGKEKDKVPHCPLSIHTAWMLSYQPFQRDAGEINGIGTGKLSVPQECRDQFSQLFKATSVLKGQCKDNSYREKLSLQSGYLSTTDILLFLR